VNEPGTDDGVPGAPWEGGLPDEGTDPETLAAITALYREHSRWGIWPPLTPSGQWTAVRAAGSRAPGPQMPLLWVTADTSVELSAKMHHADAALRPDWGKP
jgi:hypothetical protein